MRMYLSTTVAIAFALLAAPAGALDGAPASVAVPPASAAPVSTDHAFALLGTWSCSTAQNSDTSITFKQTAPDTIVARASVTNPAVFGVMITGDTYRYDPASQQWALDSARTPAFGSYHGTAGPWTQTQWVFYGNEPLPHNGEWQTTPVRQVFTDLSPTSYRREFQVSTASTWRDFSEEVCNRAK